MPEQSMSTLLDAAVNEPGTIAAAYTAFHSYSIGNALLAFAQCKTRDLPVGPIATYARWQTLGRHVKKGEKALALCMPVTMKAKTGTPDEATFTRFVYRNNWFVLAQTEGADLPPATVPHWDKSHALATLDIAEIPFDLADGNILGYARQREVAISPVNPHPYKTLFHEMAHILLGHTAEAAQTDDARTPRTLRECEAEAVALLCAESLGLPGAAESRGYIQHWHGQGNPIPEPSAQKIMKVAGQILKAGQINAADDASV